MPHNDQAQPRLTAPDRSGNEGKKLSSVGWSALFGQSRFAEKRYPKPMRLLIIQRTAADQEVTNLTL